MNSENNSQLKAIWTSWITITILWWGWAMLKQRPNIRLSHRYRYAEDINENGIVIQLIKFVELSKKNDFQYLF